MSFPLVLQSLTIILSPLYIWRADLPIPFLSQILPGSAGVLPFTFLEVLILLTFIITARDFIKQKVGSNRLKTGFDLEILIFIVAAIVALSYSLDKIGGLGILKAYFIEPILFFYCLVWTARQKGYSSIINSLIIAGLWLSLLGFLQKLTGSYTLAPHEIAQGRISAVFNSANSLALFLGPVAILSLARFISQKIVWKKGFYLGVFTIISLAMIWTRSRGGLVGEIGGILAVVYILIALKNRVLKKVWYVGPVVCLILLGLFFYQFYASYDFSKIDYKKPYTDGDTVLIRFFLWGGTANLLSDYPITGAGLNSFKTLYTNEYRPVQYQEEFQYPHNILLTFWTETGLLGLLAFLLLIAKASFIVIKQLNSQKNQLMGAALIGSLFYLMIHGMVDVPYFKNDLSLEFWTLLGLIEVWRQAKT